MWFNSIKEKATSIGTQLGSKAKDLATNLIVLENNEQNYQQQPQTQQKKQKSIKMNNMSEAAQHTLLMQPAVFGPQQDEMIMMNANFLNNQAKQSESNLSPTKQNNVSIVQEPKPFQNQSPQQNEQNIDIQKLQSNINQQQPLNQYIIQTIEFQNQIQELQQQIAYMKADKEETHKIQSQQLNKIQTLEEENESLKKSLTSQRLQIKSEMASQNEKSIQEKIHTILQENVQSFIGAIKQQIIKKLVVKLKSSVEADEDLQQMQGGANEFFKLFCEDVQVDVQDIFQANMAMDFTKFQDYFIQDDQFYQLKQNFEQLQQINEKLSQNEKVVQEQLKQLQVDQSKTVESYIDKEKQCNDLQNTTEQQKKDMQELQERLRHQEVKLLQHTEEMARTYEEINQKQQQIIQLQKSNEEFNIRCNELNQQLEEQQKKLLEKSEQILNINNQLEVSKTRDFEVKHQLILKFQQDVQIIMKDYCTELAKGIDNTDINEINEEYLKKTNIDSGVGSEQQMNNFIKESKSFLGKISKTLLEKYKISLENVKKLERMRYDKLVENFNKLQEDLKQQGKKEKDLIIEIDYMKKIIQQLEESSSGVSAQVKEREQKIKDLQKNLQDANENKNQLNEQIKNFNEKRDLMKQRQKKMKEEGLQLKQYIQELEQKLKEEGEQQKELTNKDEQLRELTQRISDRDQQLERLQNGLTDLQSVHEEQQKRNEAQAIKYDTELKKLRTELEKEKKKNEKAIQMEKDNEILIKEKEAIEMKTKELELKLQLVEQEKNDIKLETSAIIKQFKNEVVFKEHMIDKRVISNFLLQYFDQSTMYQVKLQILETLSSVLNFTEDQRSKLGLHKKKLERQHQISNQNEENKVDQKSLPDKLIEYIINTNEDK